MAESQPTAAGAARAGSVLGVPDYSAHPFLDPDLPHSDRAALRSYARLFREYTRQGWRYQQMLNRLLHPLSKEHPLEVNERILASYLRDASAYVSDLLRLLPPDHREHCQPDAEVDGCDDMRHLAELLFSVRDRRRVFEAQRKLYLAKLLIQIDRTRVIQDGPRHRRYLLELLDQEVWRYVVERHDSDLCYDVSDEGLRLVEGDEERRPGVECWHFHVQRVVRDLPGGTYDVEIFHFDTRFKKESAGYDYDEGHLDYEVDERQRYPGMERHRSASILSKMLRKGLNNPTDITDILGAKFIVQRQEGVYRLADLLHQVLGGPFSFRNQVDTFRRPQDRSQLNRFSAEGFRVLKEDLDILYPGNNGEGAQPYLFAVELQIFTVDSFLATVHSRDYSSHREYKRRQFLLGVMPCIFPESVYGPMGLPESLGAPATGVVARVGDVAAPVGEPAIPAAAVLRTPETASIPRPTPR